MGSTVVQGAASREGQAGVQPILLYQLPRTVLQSLTWKTNDIKGINQRTSAEPDQPIGSDLQCCSFQKASPDVNHRQTRFDEAANMLPDLSVGLSRLSKVIPHLLVGSVQRPSLLGGHSPHCAAP